MMTAVSMALFFNCLFDQFKARWNPTPITLKLTSQRHKLLLLLAYQVRYDYSAVVQHGELNPKHILFFAT